MQFIKDYQTVISALVVTFTLVATLIGTGVKLWTKIKNQFLKGVLRLQVWNNTLPLAERVDAGETYIRYGWNGPTKVKHMQNVEEFERQVRNG